MAAPEARTSLLENGAPLSPLPLLPYANAFAETPFLCDLIPEREQATAVGALNRILVYYPRVAALAAQGDRYSRAVDVTKALLFLYARSKDKKRKYNDEPPYEHSIRVAEMFLDVVHAGGFTKGRFLVDGTVAAIMHDMIEDFGTTKQEIRKVFPRGSGIATAVSLMTTPKTEYLAQSFENKSKVDIAQIKKISPHAYEDMKSRLKLLFKNSVAPYFSLSVLIIKAVDNADSLRTYTQDVLRKNVEIIRSDFLGEIPHPSHVRPVPLSSTKMLRNILDRTNYQRHSIDSRFDIIIENHRGRATCEAIGKMKQAVHKIFWEARDDSASYAEVARSRPLLERAIASARVMTANVSGSTARTYAELRSRNGGPARASLFLINRARDLAGLRASL